MDESSRKVTRCELHAGSNPKTVTRYPQRAANLIEVIFFDLGNVILPFSHFQIAEKLLRFTGRKEFQDPSKIFAYLFDPHSGAVNRFDTGKVSAPRFFQSVREDLLLSLSFQDFIPIWTEIFTEDREVSEAVLSFRGMCRLGLLSNTDPLHFQYVLPRFPVLSAFEKRILSYEVGAKKPDVRIYRAAVEWASVAPKKILLIDDMEENVQAAVSLGMQGIRFRSASQMKEELVLRFHFPGVNRVPRSRP